MATSIGRSLHDMPGRAVEAPRDSPVDDDYTELSLVDIARVIHRRRVVLASIVAAALVAGAAVTIFTPPEYRADASIIALAQGTVIQSWLESRQAAEVVVGAIGVRLHPVLYPDEWDARTGSWTANQPSLREIANELRENVLVSGGDSGIQPTIVLSVTLTDAALAAEVASAYLDTLSELRPQLEAITRAEYFDKYYDGTNGQEAQDRAEMAAKQKSYWLVFDEPTVPKEPVKPRPVLNMALSGVLGILAGVFVVFGLEWLAEFRVEFERMRPPPPG